MNDTAPIQAGRIAIGWDVGGWNCDKNRNSKDAIVILGPAREPLGQPWRGNLTRTIEQAANAMAFIDALLQLCKAARPSGPIEATIAVDAPLAFPQAAIALFTCGAVQSGAFDNHANPYLYRKCEQLLAQQGKQPLSVIKDMIGSQSTKAIHAVRKHAPYELETGVWGDRAQLTMIETYPGAVRHRTGEKGGGSDVEDATLCAHIAHAFGNDRGSLEPPAAGMPVTEGWIWLPHSPNTVKA